MTAQAPKPIYREIKQSRTLEVFSSGGDLSHAAAYKVASILNNCLQKKPACSLALSGGSTPKQLYGLLAQGEGGRVEWNRVEIFFSDERNVGPDDSESNYRMAKESLFSSGLIPEANIHRIKGELPAQVAAQEYEAEIIKIVGSGPVLDLVLLGLGADGHTASLFPGSPALAESEKLVAGNHVEKLNADRVTFTYPFLNQAARVMFLVSGSNKSKIVRAVLNGEGDLPSQHVRPTNGELMWMLDKDSASAYMKRSSRSA